jgi:carbonic anhydrase/acetyltransferase-like protein (isoleucine patch superfamily)
MRVPRGSLVLGSPGRVVRTLKERDIESIRHGCAVYVEMAERARKNI